MVPDDTTLKRVLTEIFHLLGRGNEHTRTDRDKFVTILWQNILTGTLFVFLQVLSGQTCVIVYIFVHIISMISICTTCTCILLRSPIVYLSIVCACVGTQVHECACIFGHGFIVRHMEDQKSKLRCRVTQYLIKNKLYAFDFNFIYPCTLIHLSCLPVVYLRFRSRQMNKVILHCVMHWISTLAFTVRLYAKRLTIQNDTRNIMVSTEGVDRLQ